VLELFRKRLDIVSREQSRDVCGLRRITANKLNGVFPLEDAGNLIAGHQNRNPTRRTAHPLGELSLGMGVGAVHFIQNQTQGSHVAS
jgi:hypothetical protein